ncbi:MAG: adenylate kinase family protein [Methanobrevibacter sp.]|uniref:adenylate kinase family protein n=1 Tax=Methanobrevibacter sp. TaxID=66852 RepID=UPI0025DDE0F6|nr:adenylate kinase family protein [Methanobrevibacter sp.]MBQ6138388.1 adenylate kinase family protein [Methanobrevibacter sp.]
MSISNESTSNKSISNKSILEDLSKDTVIFISGTPCTGKTTVANDLNGYLSDNGFDSKLIKINDFAFENDLVIGEDPDKFYKVIDIDGLNECLNDEIDKSSNRVLIVEGHLSHLCEGADKMIVLRLNPSILKNRLEERNYSESKIQENLEAEALAVCSAEAYEIYGDKTNEIDASDKSVEEIRDFIISIAADKMECPVGSIDFMKWLLE